MLLQRNYRLIKATLQEWKLYGQWKLHEFTWRARPQGPADGFEKGTKTWAQIIQVRSANPAHAPGKALDQPHTPTIDNPGHPPQPQEYQEPNSFKLVLSEDEDNIKDERHNNNNAVQHFKLVVEELPAVDKDFKPHLNQKDG